MIDPSNASHEQAAEEHKSEERKFEQQSDMNNARAEADAQRAEQVEDQEGPDLGDIGSLED